MANQELYNKTYSVPSDVINYINKGLISHPHGNGVKRAKFIIKNGVLTYQELKRLKNFFDTFNPQTDDRNQYELAGGQLMKAFIETTLNADRHAVKSGKEVKRDMTANPNSELMPYQTPRLNEETKKIKKNDYDIDDYENLIKNALAVVVNNDNKILLLKRSDYPDQWQPEKWSLVGGGVEKDEEPDEACAREIKEETNLVIDVNEFIERVVIQRNPGSVEHIFACRYNGEPTDVELNKEHSNYGWFDITEMEFLDVVPNLIDYINLVFKKYE